MEAIAHFKQGLGLLVLVPDWSRRSDIETRPATCVRSSLFATKGLGSPEAAEAYERARVLCEASGDIVRLVSALWGLWHAYNSPTGRRRPMPYATKC